jgi:hypothetical protein
VCAWFSRVCAKGGRAAIDDVSMTQVGSVRRRGALKKKGVAAADALLDIAQQEEAAASKGPPPLLDIPFLKVLPLCAPRMRLAFSRHMSSATLCNA